MSNQKIDDYSPHLARATSAITERIKRASGADIVAKEILRAIAMPHRMRRPVGFEARLLSRLRRFMPPGMVDRGIRKTFGLN